MHNMLQKKIHKYTTGALLDTEDFGTVVNIININKYYIDHSTIYFGVLIITLVYLSLHVRAEQCLPHG